jgi:hypothetical protein
MADTSPLLEEKVLFEKLGEIARNGTLWAILDACDAPEVPSRVHQLGNTKAVSLYRGRAELAYWGIAPYLVSVDETLLVWIRQTLWTTPWGIFVEADGDLERLRTHFRKFLLVEGSRGRKMYFRFYDPRVLQTFLRRCNDTELIEFFGPIRRILLGQGGGDQTPLLVFRRAIRSPQTPYHGTGLRHGARS